MKTSVLAPVLLFTYKRLDVLKLTVKALQENIYANESDLYIFSDAAKSEKDENDINNVRDFIKKINGFKNVFVVESPINKGLAASIINNVSEIIKKYGRVIVLEDDLITSSNFLSFMNQSLDFYSEQKNILSIAGYSIPMQLPLDYKYDCYFLPRPSSWGWATWENRWTNVDWKVSTFSELKKNKSQIKAFNEGGSDLYDMLLKQMTGKIDSWAIRWTYHHFINRGYALCPIVSKTKNIGFNNTATHTNVYNRYSTTLDKSGKTVFYFPAQIEPDKRFVSQFQFFYSLKSRAIGKLKTYLYKAGLYKND